MTLKQSRSGTGGTGFVGALVRLLDGERIGRWIEGLGYDWTADATDGKEQR